MEPNFESRSHVQSFRNIGLQVNRWLGAIFLFPHSQLIFLDFQVEKNDRIASTIIHICLDNINEFNRFRELCTGTATQMRISLELPHETAVDIVYGMNDAQNIESQTSNQQIGEFSSNGIHKGESATERKHADMDSNVMETYVRTSLLFADCQIWIFHFQFFLPIDWLIYRKTHASTASSSLCEIQSTDILSSSTLQNDSEWVAYPDAEDSPDVNVSWIEDEPYSAVELEDTAVHDVDENEKNLSAKYSAMKICSAKKRTKHVSEVSIPWIVQRVIRKLWCNDVPFGQLSRRRNQDHLRMSFVQKIIFR